MPASLANRCLWGPMKSAGNLTRRFFRISEVGSSIRTEVLSGLSAFLTMAYIIPVNAAIIGDTGGPCIEDLPGVAWDDPSMLACLATVKRDLIVATTVASMMGSLVMGLWANLPLHLMPGMGMNAYFSYTVVGFMGTGSVAYRTALTAVFLEGIIFLILSLTGVRSQLKHIMPASIQLGMSAGIGIFLAFIGLQGSVGLGAVVGNDATLVTLGGCPPEFREPMGSGGAYYCAGGVLSDPTLWLGVFGLVLMAFLMMKKVPGGLFMGIAFISCISWIRGTAVTYFPYSPEGESRFDFFKQVFSFHLIEKTAGQLRWDRLGSSEVWIALMTLLYTDVLDSTGTFLALGRAANLTTPSGTIRSERAAFCSDAIATSFGSLLGTSPTTTASESMAAVVTGGRTGLSSVTSGLMMFLCLFFAPVFASVPPYATGPALIVVGSLMASNLTTADLADPKVAIPTFVTMATIPLTYSVAYGLVAGVILSLILNTLDAAWEIARGRLTFKSLLKRRHSEKRARRDRLAEEFGCSRCLNLEGSDMEDESWTSSQPSEDRVV